MDDDGQPLYGRFGVEPAEKIFNELASEKLSLPCFEYYLSYCKIRLEFDNTFKDYYELGNDDESIIFKVETMNRFIMNVYEYLIRKNHFAKMLGEHNNIKINYIGKQFLYEPLLLDLLIDGKRILSEIYSTLENLYYEIDSTRLIGEVYQILIPNQICYNKIYSNKIIPYILSVVCAKYPPNMLFDLTRQ